MIRTVRERGRGILNEIPYYYLPSQITIHLIYLIVMWLNELPYGKGVSQKYYLRKIVTGQHLDFKKNFRVVLNKYVKNHHHPNITKKIAPSNHEYVALGPTRNIQGTQKVFLLNPGFFLKRRNIIPMIETYRVINIVY